ncbi:MAG TPA: hypothetical protein GXZ95_03020 [Mollicutes bacterium]|nr:hypothetical protein [Mollicutes bacterium]
MNETTRKILIKELENQKQLLKKQGNLEKELEELEQEPVVQEYFKISNEIERIKNQHIGKTEKERIAKTLAQLHKDKEHKCLHPLFFYAGSYNKNDRILKNEFDKAFYYNHYFCLECKRLVTKGKDDYKEFEENNPVIKHVFPLTPGNNGYKYMDMFYKLHEYYRLSWLDSAEKEVVNKTNGYAKTLIRN